MASFFISERLVKIIRPIDTMAIQGSTYFIALGLKLVSTELNHVGLGWNQVEMWSVSNIRKISGPANLDFLLRLHCKSEKKIQVTN